MSKKAASAQQVKQFNDIPNVGPATVDDFNQLGLQQPTDLIGQDPYNMHQRLCQLTGIRHDPCVIDVFIAAVKFMEGGPPQKWWEFTAERKKHLQQS